jgi:hypothetical protein
MEYATCLDPTADVQVSHLALIGSRIVDIDGVEHFGFIMSEVAQAYRDITGKAMPINDYEVRVSFTELCSPLHMQNVHWL